MKNKRVYFRLIPIAGAMIMAFMLLMFNMVQISAAQRTVMTTKDGKWKFELHTDSKTRKTTASLCKYTGKVSTTGTTTVTIPTQVTADGKTSYSVTSIGCDAHGYNDYKYKCYSMLVDYRKGSIKIVIPTSVIKINDSAFFGASSVKSVVFNTGSQCTSIGEFAFGETEISEITIPDKVKTIGCYAFSECDKLVTVKFGAKSECTYIADYAFSNDPSLKTLKLPDSLTSIEAGIIEGCKKLTKLEIPTGVKVIRNSAFSDCKNTLVTFAKGSKCEKIETCAFSDASDAIDIQESDLTCVPAILGDLVIPASVKRIEEYAFGSNASITSVKFEAGSKCTYIGGSAFAYCNNMKSIRFPASLKTFERVNDYSEGGYQLYGCTSLQTITMEAGIKISYIPNNFAERCSRLKSICIPKNVVSIGDNAFDHCTSLASVTFEKGSKCKEIESQAFAGCESLKKISLSAALADIGEMAFIACENLRTIDVASDTIVIGFHALGIHAHNVDEGADWAEWVVTSPFDGEIYVNSSSVKKQVVDNDDIPDKTVIVRAYDLELQIKNGDRYTKAASKKLNYAQVFKLSEIAPKPPVGYDYEWSENPDRPGERYRSSGSVTKLTKDGRIVLKGSLVEHRYSIIYDGNGGTGRVSNQEDILYSRSSSLRENRFVRSGYVFLGWNTKADGSGMMYKPSEMVKELTIEDSITLYASWGKIESISYYMPDSVDNGRFVCSRSSYQCIGSTDLAIKTFDEVRLARSQNGQVNEVQLTYSFVDAVGKEYKITKNIADISACTGWRQIENTQQNRISFRYPGVGVENDRTQGEQIVVDSSMSLVPNYVYKDLEISFDGNGAVGSMEDVHCTAGSVTAEQLANAYSKEGYEFAGWTVSQLESDYGAVPVISDSDLEREDIGGQILYSLYMFADGNRHITLKAMWNKQETYNIQFRPNGGKGTMKTVTYICGQDRKLPDCTFTREGYVFQGWNVIGDSSVTYADGAVINRTVEQGDVRLQAVWKVLTYSIIYDANGGYGYMETENVDSGSSHILMFVNYEKDGSSFLEWNTAADGSGRSYEDRDSIVYKVSGEGESIRLYAIWNPDTITISFDPNGGTVSRSAKMVEYGEECGELPVPKREGYEFEGWFTGRNGGDQYESGTVIDVSSDFTLYAKWKAAEYTVSFDLNGGSGSGAASRKVKAGESIGVLPRASRKGYAFDGWFTARTGGSKVSAVFTVKSDRTLYAHWTCTTKSVIVTMNVAKVKNIKGYELQYSTSGGFGGAVTLTSSFHGQQGLVRQVSGLRADTVYYFRARSYTVKNGKKVYGAWSAVATRRTSK